MTETDNTISTILETEYYAPHELEIRSDGYLTVIDKNKELVTTQPSDNQIVDDANFARDRMYDVISQGEAALDLIGKISKESQHPRSLEVMGQLLKTQSDNIDKLLKIQKEKKELTKEQPPTPNNITVEKAVFVGSTSELLKQVRQDKTK